MRNPGSSAKGAVRFLSAALGLSLASVAPGLANERHLTYTYESAVLPRDEREVELWSTYRTGRRLSYTRFDHRAEFEFGLTDRLMTAFYFNWKDVTAASAPTGALSREFAFEGISSEFKYKLSDPVASKIGSALYGEASLSSHGFELETKLILDKRAGNNLFAYNLTLEPEWEREPGEFEFEELGLENSLAWTHFFKPSLATGIEVRSHTEFTPEHKPEHSALFAGPVFSYARERWWVAFTVLRQLPALERSVDDPGQNLVLDEHERYNARLLLSFQF